MPTEAIKFSNVSKSYKIYKNRPTTLKEKVVDRILNRNKTEIIEHHVVKDASFTIYAGQTVGIIGRNGAGKSTVLKMIAQIISPDNGQITVNGSVSSLLEIGAGFQPDLTGRENVFLYGSILGMSKRYIEEHYDEIVDFAQLHDFMDTAVKNYSSGMYMRLAFSVAIHVDPEILIIDEVLAVGDAEFQKKCFAKIREFQKRGKTIVFVSHDMSSVRDLCDQVIFIDREGQVTMGETDSQVNKYYTKIYGGDDSKTQITDSEKIDLLEIDEFKKHVNYNAYNNPNNRWGNGEVTIENVYFSNTQGIVQNVFPFYSDIVINLEIRSKKKLNDVVVGLAIYDEKGNHLSGPNSKQDGVVVPEVEGKKTLKIILKQPPFLQGTYLVTLSLYDYACKEAFDYLDKYYQFSIINNREEFGIVKIQCDWNI
ncbi:MAG: ABC transporter ATP-binding protein [Cohnella sp.]|uniref:ABC transporter ATP-binding protein n=1 Tax=Cohnella sp. TaxID=1883426 RepID=UPI000E39F102|nr:ABC transporter ATP-binding protein [Cohnella sp.]REK66505.1 MAG: ABC transporter ATP-binding protein [Cohnella sp.]